MKLTFSKNKHLVTYDIVAKTAFAQEFVERRKVMTNELNEEKVPAEYEEAIEQKLIVNEIEKLTNIIWNCKNTLRFSQDVPKIVSVETKRMSDSHEKIKFLKTLILAIC